VYFIFYCPKENVLKTNIGTNLQEIFMIRLFLAKKGLKVNEVDKVNKVNEANKISRNKPHKPHKPHKPYYLITS